MFESAGSGLTQEQEEFLNKYTEGSWKYNTATGLVDVVGDFDCERKKLQSLAGIKFGKVSGNFVCGFNQLTSLEGAPQKVGGDFYCRNNGLTSLKGAPREVGRDFNCSRNELTSLEGAPQRVEEDFRCNDNQLTSLEGAPREVGGDFYCSSNELTSLVGAPQEVGGTFYCSNNQLTTLEGAPQGVKGGFNCVDNKLTSLEGAPQKVGKYFVCSGNKLTSLEGAPQEIGGDFDCGYFYLPKGQWNPEGWLKILKNRRPKAQPLILTLLTPEDLNREIQKDPAGMIMKLKEVWNEERFREIRSKLVWPRGYEEEMDIVSGLNTLGF